MTADTIVPQAGDPQAFNRYAYVRNNPIMLNDPSGHCWGSFSGVRSVGFMNTLCQNTDSAFEVMTNPDASVAQRAVGATYLFIEGGAAITGTVGVAMLGASAAPAVGTYATAAISYVQTATTAAAAAYPTASAIVGGVAETAVECGMTGGGCNWTDYAWGAATAGVASVSAKRQGCDRSFSEDTLVTTEEGLVPISEIEEGNYVLAYNEETGEVGYYPVTATWVHEDPVLTYLVIEGEFIATTPTHLFYTTEGWVEAGELGEDAYVVRAGDAPGQVWESLTFPLPRQMYDLTVAEAHTFFIGEQQWLVHNCGGTSPLPDEAPVCRGGLCTADNFLNGSGVTVNPNGTLSNVSVNSAVDVPLSDLTQTIRNGQVGVTTVGTIRAHGGNVYPAGRTGNPYHCVMCGLTAEVAESLFTPTISNPSRIGGR